MALPAHPSDQDSSNIWRIHSFSRFSLSIMLFLRGSVCAMCTISKVVCLVPSVSGQKDKLVFYIREEKQ